jgi:hypothetical protein
MTLSEVPLLELLLSGLGMLACMAAMTAIMPLFGRVVRLARRARVDDTGEHRGGPVSH